MRNLWLVWIWIAALFVWNVAARAQTALPSDPRDPYFQIAEIEQGEPVVLQEKLTAEKLEDARQNFKAQYQMMQLQQNQLQAYRMHTIDARIDLPTLESGPLSAPNAGTHAEERGMAESWLFGPTAISPYMIAQLLMKAWDLVIEGKPVVNIEVKNASALPIMADYNWSMLTGWRAERIVKWPLRIKNLYGQTPVRMDTAVRLLYGGSARGRGMYIASARVIPSNVEVWNGYNLDVSVNVPSVINVSGREDDPIAQITLEINYKLRSHLGSITIKKSEWNEIFKVQGDGYFLDYKYGKEFFQPVYHAPAPALPSPTATPLPTDSTGNGPLLDDPFGSPTPTPAKAGAKKPAASPTPAPKKPASQATPTPSPTPKKPAQRARQ